MKTTQKIKKLFLEVLINPEGIHRWYLEKAIREIFDSWGSYEIDCVLDFGCGSCPYQEILERVAKKVITVDIGDNPLADIRLSAGQGIPVQDSSIGLVVSFQVLEHVNEYTRYLLECSRICRRNGFLVLSVPSVWPFHAAPTDYRRWMADGLRFDLERAGFRIVKLIPVLNPLSTAIQYFLSVCQYSLWPVRRGWFIAKCLGLLLNPLIIFFELFGRKTFRFGAGNYVVLAERI